MTLPRGGVPAATIPDVQYGAALLKTVVEVGTVLSGVRRFVLDTFVDQFELLGRFREPDGVAQRLSARWVLDYNLKGGRRPWRTLPYPVPDSPSVADGCCKMHWCRAEEADCLHEIRLARPVRSDQDVQRTKFQRVALGTERQQVGDSDLTQHILIPLDVP